MSKQDIYFVNWYKTRYNLRAGLFHTSPQIRGDSRHISYGNATLYPSGLDSGISSIGA